MSVLLQAITPGGGLPGPTDDFWYSDIGSALKTAMKVTPDTAMQLSTVLACVDIISEIFALFPLKIYEELSDEIKRVAKEHLLYPTLHDQPNFWQTSFEWREMMMGHFLLRGNGYSRIIPDLLGRGSVGSLLPLHPDRVTPKLRRQNNIIPVGPAGLMAGDLIVYEYRRPDGATEIIPWDEMFHVRGYSVNGIEGISRIKQAAMSVGLSMASIQYATDFYKNGGQMGTFFRHPQKLKDAARKNLKKSIMDMHIGPGKAWRPILLEEDMDVKSIGVTPEDGLLLGILKYGVVEIARIFRVPLHLIQEHEKQTSWGKGIQELGMGFRTYTMLPHCTRWEQVIKRDLIAEPDRFSAAFTMDALLRADQKTRHEAHKSGIYAGWLGRNEVRKKEDLNPDPVLDGFLLPKNMGIAGEEPAESYTPGGNGDKQGSKQTNENTTTDEDMNHENRLSPIESGVS